MSSSLPIREFGNKVPGITYVDRPGAYAFLFNDARELAVIRTGHGMFLPGGGLDPGEDSLAALERELFEEIAFKLVNATLLGQAAQYHWSAFYGKHFKKIGSFYRVEATPPPSPKFQKDHELLWIEPGLASRQLTQEFQRWAVGEFVVVP